MRSAQEGEIREVTRRWADRFNARDAAALTALYDLDAVLWGTLSPEIISTFVGVKGYFDSACTSPMALTVVFDKEVVRPCEDIMLNSGSYTFTFVRDGQQQQFPARFSMVFRKRGGQWLIVDHHSSAKPQAPKAQ